MLFATAKTLSRSPVSRIAQYYPSAFGVKPFSTYLIGSQISTAHIGCSDSGTNESGTSSFANSFNTAYDASYRKQWHANFISSCIGKDSGNNGKARFCNCVADTAVSELTKTQMNNINLIKTQLLPKCRDTA